MGSARQSVARYALVIHDRLRASNAREPALDDGGMPLDSAAWLAWREHDNKPAYIDWRNAMDALDAMLGEPVRRHPFMFRPLCESIIAGEA